MTSSTVPIDISAELESHRSDVYLMVGNSNNADIFYATHFFASDQFAYFQTKDGKETLLISDMERGRAEIESRVSDIRTLQDLDYRAKVKERKDPSLAYCDCIAEVLQKGGAKRVAVPRDFPYYIAQTLKEEGFSIEAMKSPFAQLRSKKASSESDIVKKVQDACNSSMKAAAEMVRKSEVVEGVLTYHGFALTSEMVRKEIDMTLLEHGCESDSTIVAGGTGSSNPHWEGEGPLKANEPIVIDIFPRSKKERYFADMTRTVLKGEPSEKLADMYEAVLAAQEAGIAMVKPGVKCSDIHNKVCDVFKERGYDTIREGSNVGFIHSTGHGVGLEIHELPFVGNSDVELEEGNIITIEPGLYYPDVGGIRLEDLILVTSDGHENLTEMEKRFVY
ncbi:M24 family metallopeptidase [Methanolobus profundi]|uniref:Xaa-Pro aminopeptidase n=1 Tax=Methanolobus profundi TaxID=487685 RepID=A0A1I4R8G0_9EURY|nr:Xaa-Pro peptidase family protein [Methanolobus profundi]SFM48509.1 Xaa-Pro aminopeptidase [Methanolobus profundi]